MLGKRVSIASQRYAEIKVEAFNLLNHPNFGAPARDVATPNTFGTISSAVGVPRTVELVFKFYF
ncbi:MAG: hypothetical protein GEU99_00980 [Luteitalea sp.]|nr:hypothetical protein [Luteitalea sp.]